MRSAAKIRVSPKPQSRRCPKDFLRRGQYVAFEVKETATDHDLRAFTKTRSEFEDKKNLRHRTTPE